MRHKHNPKPVSYAPMLQDHPNTFFISSNIHTQVLQKSNERKKGEMIELHTLSNF